MQCARPECAKAANAGTAEKVRSLLLQRRPTWKQGKGCLSPVLMVNKLHHKKVVSRWSADHLLTMHLLTTYRPSTDHLLTTYRPLTDHLLTAYQPPTNHLLTAYQPPTNHLLTTY